MKRRRDKRIQQSPPPIRTSAYFLGYIQIRIAPASKKTIDTNQAFLIEVRLPKPVLQNEMFTLSQMLLMKHHVVLKTV